MRCYDTSFLIAYQNGDPDTLDHLEAHGESSHLASAVSLFELYRGDVLGHSRQTPRQTREGLSWLDQVLPMDQRTAMHAAELLDRVRDAGGSLDPVDAMIAASSDLVGATLVTRDDDLLSASVSRVLDVESY